VQLVGLGTVGGGNTANPSRAWINGPYSLRVVGLRWAITSA
jgi:hypothetical protein